MDEFERDYIMRQVQMLVRFVARLVFHRDAVHYEVQNPAQNTETDLLAERVLSLLAQGEAGRAEDALFDGYDPENRAQLALALDFYDRLNGMDDAALEALHFPREEIDAGLRALLGRSGIDTLGM